MTSRAKTTQLLIKWRHGDEAALHELMPRVYRELRGLANYYLGRERPDHTLQPTALVHEAFLKLVGSRHPCYENRVHFYGIATRLMRQVLVDTARARAAGKRGAEIGRASCRERV